MCRRNLTLTTEKNIFADKRATTLSITTQITMTLDITVKNATFSHKRMILSIITLSNLRQMLSCIFIVVLLNAVMFLLLIYLLSLCCLWTRWMLWCLTTHPVFLIKLIETKKLESKIFFFCHQSFLLVRFFFYKFIGKRLKQIMYQKL